MKYLAVIFAVLFISSCAPTATDSTEIKDEFIKFLKCTVDKMDLDDNLKKTSYEKITEMENKTNKLENCSKSEIKIIANAVKCFNEKCQNSNKYNPLNMPAKMNQFISSCQQEHQKNISQKCDSSFMAYMASFK